MFVSKILPLLWGLSWTFHIFPLRCVNMRGARGRDLWEIDSVGIALSHHFCFHSMGVTTIHLWNRRVSALRVPCAPFIFGAPYPNMGGEHQHGCSHQQVTFGLHPQLLVIYYRRKFRSQTSDSMDRWKAEVVRVKEEKKSSREKIGEEKESEERRSRRAKR